jgi:hypothetical protein
MNQPLYDFFQHVEGEYQYAKNESFPRGGNQKGLVLIAFPELRVFPDHDDLSDHSCIDQGKSDAPILFYVELPQQEHVVDRKGAEKESQIEEQFEHFPKLMFDLFSALWMCRIHDSLRPREVADEEGAMTHAPFCFSTIALRVL